MNQVVILHGWSDSSRSFAPLARFLKDNGFAPIPIWLGDYESRDDDVGVPDVARRMQSVIEGLLGKGQLKAPFDMIVHSTGGLVAREWLSAHYGTRMRSCPLKRLIMLAPANFGSKLAAMGQSMLGRVVKGWNNWFHTGARMLDQLELASPYQWDLAFRDLFVPPGQSAAPALYGGSLVWPFVIVGTHPYPGTLRRIVNEDGSDGTVRVSASNLNVRGTTIDFSADEQQPAATPWKLRHTQEVPFAVLPDRTHASIIAPQKSDVGAQPAARRVLTDLVLRALRCPDARAYRQLARDWGKVSEATSRLASDTTTRAATFRKGGQSTEFFHQYLQALVRVRDDHGDDVDDYFLQFFSPKGDPKDDATTYFHREVLEHVHVNRKRPAYRCLYVDRTDLVTQYYARIGAGVERILAMNLSAAPLGTNVGYFKNFKKGAAGHLHIHREDTTHEPRWFKRNTTHFVDIVIPRVAAERVFKLTKT